MGILVYKSGNRLRCDDFVKGDDTFAFAVRICNRIIDIAYSIVEAEWVSSVLRAPFLQQPG